MRNATLKLYVRIQTLRGTLRDIVALIAFAAAAGMSTVATKINTAFTSIGTKLTTYTS